MFALECEMIPFILNGLSTIIKAEAIACANELPVNGRVVDVVAAPVNKSLMKTSNETASLLRHLSMIQLDLLAILMLKPTTSIQCLCRFTFMHTKQIHEVFINPCLELGLIERVSRYTYTPTDWVQALPTEIVAIEAKLARWQEALNQANNNLVFADYSFVALAEEKVPRNRESLNMFRNAGIGLFSVNSNGDIKLIVSPNKSSLIGRDSHMQKIRLLRDLHKPNNSKWKLCH